MQIQGHFQLEFEPVRDAFAALFDDPQERGAALCIQRGGETVVDLWAGSADKDGQQAWHSDTILNLFSCTKAFTSVAVLQLAAEGKLDLDAPVARYWPEFAAAGKAEVTVRQLLCHRAGLPAIRQALAPEALYRWQTMVGVLAAEAPWWEPGTAHGYAAVTFGWLLGELLRRVEDREPGPVIVDRVARPLGLDFHIGLADSEFDRVAHIARGKGNAGDEAARRLLQVTLHQPEALSTLAFTNPPGMLTSTNKPEWRRMQQPAANGHGNARSLAGFYAGLLDGTLLDPHWLAQMTREHSYGEDLTLLTSTRFGLGVMLDQPGKGNATFGMGPRAFGHPGAGGSCGFADPAKDVAFGFVTNTLGPYILMDPRAQRLAQVLARCIP
ncbi:serine hydrolase [Pseudomonas typographi]|uniref:serine hydrolase n=1 Tax=Pseudomonas typographi TaxID=2715964 RepID=UPI001681CBD6|nr:beta-lactamase family protein [Pseudomonas typographi]MBD1586677.1 beta-lactamase family protein [Pseudomonas typographi]